MKTILSVFLREMHIPFTTKYADTTFTEHPYRDSMYGLSSMLSGYKIKNMGIHVDDKDLKELKTPCIVLMSNDFAVVKNVNDKAVEYIWKNKDIVVPIERFKNLWSGFVLVAEPDKDSAEPNYRLHRRNAILNHLQEYSLFTLLVGWLFWICISNRAMYSVTYVLLILACLLGLGITYLLMLKQIKLSNEYADKICSLFKKGDCNSVLESKAAKLGVFSWSEIGFNYFIASLLLLLLNPQWIPYFIWINWLALPYSIWSIWYQYRVAKQWCPLCLSVMLLLWVMAIIGGITGEWEFVTLNLISFVGVAGLYLLPFCALHMFWDILFRAGQVENVMHELNSIKLSEEVFLQLLKLQPRYDVGDDVSSILFGNPDAKLRITVLSNPHCNPCAHLHDRIDALIKDMGDRLCVQFIFSSFSEALEVSARFLIAVYQNEPPEKRELIFQDWFRGKRNMGDTYINRFDYDLEATKVIQEWKSHGKWQQKYKLVTTPFIIINGYRLPDKYKIEDLKSIFQ